ncbi:MAG: GNAT family N-acetyltransferase [Candidatus Hodarchaeota archaeon]
MLEIKQAFSEESYKLIKEIFIEYANYLAIDLDFQNFDEELKNIQGNYSPPEGCILLAYFEGKIAGCVAVRKLQDDICEMKRLYVRPNYQNKTIGKELSKAIIQKAKEIGYKYMRLDTLPFMKAALKIYASLGFKEIAPYRYNPIEGAKYFELKL